MANLLIIDSDKSISALLKLTLLRQGHSIKRSDDVRDAIDRSDGIKPDLVLINHSFNKNSGWKAFNCIKQIVPNMPAIIYVLDDLNTANAELIGKIVDMILSEIKCKPQDVCCIA